MRFLFWASCFSLSQWEQLCIAPQFPPPGSPPPTPHGQKGGNKSSLHTCIALASGSIFAHSRMLHKCSCALQPLHNFVATQRADGQGIWLHTPSQSSFTNHPKGPFDSLLASYISLSCHMKIHGQNRIFGQATSAQQDPSPFSPCRSEATEMAAAVFRPSSARAKLSC